MKRIREKRNERGLTQRQLGEMVGVSESAISQFESGKKYPKGKTLIDISLALGTTVEYLLEQSENPTPQIKSGARDDFQEMLKDITPEEKKMLLAYYEWLKANRTK